MRKSRLVIIAACFTLGAVTLWGQGQGQSGGNSSGGTSGRDTGGDTGRQGGGTQQQQQGNYGNTSRQNDPFGNQQDPFGNQMRPLYLHGQVVTDDGLPPSEPVVVKRVCQGNAFPEDYTDSKGRFSFQVGGDLSMLTTDASVSGARMGPGAGFGGSGYSNDCVRQVGMGRYDLSSSVLRAELPGYRSDDVQLGMYSSMGNNDVGVIVLHRLEGVVGDVVSALTLGAPKPAQKAYQSGLREMQKKKPNYKKGVAQFEKAVRTYPKFAAAWAAMGEAKRAMNDTEGAKAAFGKAVEHDPKYLKPYEPLIELAVAQSDWASLESLGSAYLELNPNAGSVRFYTAVAALNTGKTDKAEEMVLAMRAGENADSFPQSFQIMGLVHEQRAEFEEAANQYRSFVRVMGESAAPNVQQVRRKLHEWEMLGVIQKAEPAP